MGLGTVVPMKTTLQILLLEDDIYFAHTLIDKLGEYGEVHTAHSLEQATEVLEQKKINVAFIDLHLSEDDSEAQGLKIVELCQEKSVTSLVLTHSRDQANIAKAYEFGCRHYFLKDDFVDQIHSRVGGLLQGIAQEGLLDYFQSDFITQDPVIASIVKFLIQKPKQSPERFMLVGPRGVRKAKLAKFIHKLNSNGEFIRLNLAEEDQHCWSPDYLKSLLEQAKEGTLFIQDIFQLIPRQQAILLNLLDDEKLTPANLVCSTKEDISEAISSGRFRTDLYFKIKGLDISIPGLSERPQDIPLLIEHYLVQAPRKILFDDHAMQLLVKYSWYGNTHELESLLYQLSMGDHGKIEAKHLPTHILLNQDPFLSEDEKNPAFLGKKHREFINEHGLPALINKFEKEALAYMLEESEGRINEVQRRLQISKSLLYRIMGDLKESGEAHVRQ